MESRSSTTSKSSIKTIKDEHACTSPKQSLAQNRTKVGSSGEEEALSCFKFLEAENTSSVKGVNAEDVRIPKENTGSRVSMTRIDGSSENQSTVTSDGLDLEKTYLETEIDSYSGVSFKGSSSVTNRSPTPPVPTTLRAFTFHKSNPFLSTSNPPSNIGDGLYTTVNKPKTTKPSVPPKPPLSVIGNKAKPLQNAIRPSTISLHHPSESRVGALAPTLSSTDDSFSRVNSLPNLLSHNAAQLGDSGPHSTIALQGSATLGYGVINKIRSTNATCSMRAMTGTTKESEYCHMIADSPPYENEMKNDSENVYEDVKFSYVTRVKIAPTEIESLNKDHEDSELPQDSTDSDYTQMLSPISNSSFSFEVESIYENLPSPDKMPNSEVLNSNADNYYDEQLELVEPPRQFSSLRSKNLQIHDQQSQSVDTVPSPYYANIPTDTGTSHQTFQVSPSPSFSGPSSVASTATSSFQGIQVCYFPPHSPREFYEGNVNTCGLPVGQEIQTPPISPGSISQSSTSSSRRSSRSRIPVPIKTTALPSKFPTYCNMPVPDETAPSLPPTPKPSPIVIDRNNGKGKQIIKLSPPSPPAGKGPRWYEKLGCIQSDTLRSTEPYGKPGERKRSKSLTKEHRRSQFFVPVQSSEDGHEVV